MLDSRFIPFASVGGGDDRIETVGVVPRNVGETACGCRLEVCDDGGGVMEEDGGAGELYLAFSTSCGARGEVGFATSMDVVGDIGRGMLVGSAACCG
jgi:hypothetical protein